MKMKMDGGGIAAFGWALTRGTKRDGLLLLSVIGLIRVIETEWKQGFNDLLDCYSNGE